MTPPRSGRTASGVPQCIVPPNVLTRIARECEDKEVRRAARDSVLRTLQVDHSFRLARAETAAHSRWTAAPVTFGRQKGRPQRVVYDQDNRWDQTPGKPARNEGGPSSRDRAVDDVYDYIGATYDFYWNELRVDSLDNNGLVLEAGVHYGVEYNNAFWDGTRIFFGDGDGVLFRRLSSIDVVAHELTHAVTQFQAHGLTYSGQAGALNESISDVFGVLVKQRHLGGSLPEEDRWRVGSDIVGDALKPALRSLKDPRNDVNPFSSQPAHMRDFVTTPDDQGGVHINSGIPNHAFYLAATEIGGSAWDKPAKIWFRALLDPDLGPNATFIDFANLTLSHALRIFGTGSREEQAVRDAWDGVGIPV